MKNKSLIISIIFALFFQNFSLSIFLNQAKAEDIVVPVPNVTVTSIGESQGTLAVQVLWNMPDTAGYDAYGFVLEKETPDGREQAAVYYPNYRGFNGLADSGYYYDEAVTYDQTYTYYVKAYLRDAFPYRESGWGQASIKIKSKKIDNIIVSDITTNSAKISWDTDNALKGKLYYGTDTNYQTGTKEVTEVNTHQEVSLINLTKFQTYHFKIKAYYDNENEIGVLASDDQTFTPMDFSIKVNTNNFPGISWTTTASNYPLTPINIDTTGSFEYGYTTDYGSVMEKPNKSYTHGVDIPGSFLITGKTIYFRIKALVNENSIYYSTGSYYYNPGRIEYMGSNGTQALFSTQYQSISLTVNIGQEKDVYTTTKYVTVSNYNFILDSLTPLTIYHFKVNGLGGDRVFTSGINMTSINYKSTDGDGLIHWKTSTSSNSYLECWESGTNNIQTADAGSGVEHYGQCDTPKPKTRYEFRIKSVNSQNSEAYYYSNTMNFTTPSDIKIVGAVTATGLDIKFTTSVSDINVVADPYFYDNTVHRINNLLGVVTSVSNSGNNFTVTMQYSNGASWCNIVNVNSGSYYGLSLTLTKKNNPIDTVTYYPFDQFTPYYCAGTGTSMTFTQEPIKTLPSLLSVNVLGAASQGNSEIVSYTTNQPVESYTEYGTQKDAMTSTTPKTEGSLTSHFETMTNLKPHTYYYRVVGKNQNGQTQYSDIKTLKHGNKYLRFINDFFGNVWYKIKGVFRK